MKLCLKELLQVLKMCEASIGSWQVEAIVLAGEWRVLGRKGREGGDAAQIRIELGLHHSAIGEGHLHLPRQ